MSELLKALEVLSRISTPSFVRKKKMPDDGVLLRAMEYARSEVLNVYESDDFDENSEEARLQLRVLYAQALISSVLEYVKVNPIDEIQDGDDTDMVEHICLGYNGALARIYSVIGMGEHDESS